MLSLAIDTSSAWGSVALSSSRELRHTIEFRGPQRHSTTLFPALAKMDLTSQPIKRLIVGLGPGSFSGIRVALAAAQGIALGKRATVVGINSTWSIAQQYAHVTRLGVFADARRGEMYCTIFAVGKMERDTFILPRDEVEELVGKLTLAVSSEPLDFVPERAYPRALDFLRLPEDSPLFHREITLEPIYLREAV